MNKLVAKIAFLSLLFMGVLSGCSGVSDKLDPNNADKDKLIKTPLELISQKSWGDYQQVEYDIYNQEERIGNMNMDITLASDNKSYIISKDTKKESNRIQSNVTILADTLMPMKSHYEKTSDIDSENFTINTVYSKNWQIETQAQKSSKQTIDLPQHYYDNESLLFILGELSFEDSDTFKLNVTIPLSSRLTPLEFKYDGKEQIIVPYNETECYKLTSNDMTFWYSTDHRILYQYQNGNTVYKLINFTNN
ncbi:TPA: DUF3108 domain-containing protein [Enterococcus faecium]